MSSWGFDSSVGGSRRSDVVSLSGRLMTVVKIQRSRWTKGIYVDPRPNDYTDLYHIRTWHS